MTTESGLKLEEEMSLDPSPVSSKSIKMALPLCIPTVLTNVLELLPVIDLKESRLVCHQWAEEAGKILAKQTNICFCEAMDVQRFIESSEQKDNFRNEFKRILNSVSFTNFQFRMGEDLKQYTIKSSECVKFFDMFGSSIESLELGRGVWIPSDLNDDFFSKIVNIEDFKLIGTLETPPNFKNSLKTNDLIILPKVTTFETTILPLNSSQQFAGVYFQSLLKRMPNLVTVRGCLMSIPSSSIAMWVINSPMQLPFLSHMDVQINMNEAEVLQLQNRQFPLKYLTMTIVPGIRFPGLWSLLTSLGTTLEDLKLDFGIRPNQPDTFPCSNDLRVLKKLRLQSFDGSLQFVRDMRKLQSVEVVDCNLSSAFREECEAHPTVRTFRAANCNSSAGRFIFDNVYKNIVKFFPNLKNLKMDYLSDTSLRIIFNALPNLEEFVAVQGIYSDEGLLGISPSLLHDDANECNLENVPQGEVNADVIQRQPNITYLKNLRTLSLASHRLTDDTIIYGILQCKEIKNLVISSPNITDEAVRRLVDEMDIYELQFRREYKVTASMMNYATEKMNSCGKQIYFSCD